MSESIAVFGGELPRLTLLRDFFVLGVTRRRSCRSSSAWAVDPAAPKTNRKIGVTTKCKLGLLSERSNTHASLVHHLSMDFVAQEHEVPPAT